MASPQILCKLRNWILFVDCPLPLYSFSGLIFCKPTERWCDGPASRGSGGACYAWGVGGYGNMLARLRTFCHRDIIKHMLWCDSAHLAADTWNFCPRLAEKRHSAAHDTLHAVQMILIKHRYKWSDWKTHCLLISGEGFLHQPHQWRSLLQQTSLIIQSLVFFLTSQRSAYLNNLYSYTAELQSTSACKSSGWIECARSIPHGFVFLRGARGKTLWLILQLLFLKPNRGIPKDS